MCKTTFLLSRPTIRYLISGSVSTCSDPPLPTHSLAHYAGSHHLHYSAAEKTIFIIRESEYTWQQNRYEEFWGHTQDERRGDNTKTIGCRRLFELFPLVPHHIFPVSFTLNNFSTVSLFFLPISFFSESPATEWCHLHMEHFKNCCALATRKTQKLSTSTTCPETHRSENSKGWSLIEFPKADHYVKTVPFNNEKLELQPPPEPKREEKQSPIIVEAYDDTPKVNFHAKYASFGFSFLLQLAAVISYHSPSESHSPPASLLPLLLLCVRHHMICPQSVPRPSPFVFFFFSSGFL